MEDSVFQKNRFHGLVSFHSSSMFPAYFFVSASLNIFATIPMCVLGGFLGELLGRKTVCCLVSPIFLAGFLCIALAPDIGLLLFGRVLGGIGHGLVSTSAGVISKHLTSTCSLISAFCFLPLSFVTLPRCISVRSAHLTGGRPSTLA